MFGTIWYLVITIPTSLIICLSFCLSYLFVYQSHLFVYLSDLFTNLHQLPYPCNALLHPSRDVPYILTSTQRQRPVSFVYLSHLFVISHWTIHFQIRSTMVGIPSYKSREKNIWDTFAFECKQFNIKHFCAIYNTGFSIFFFQESIEAVTAQFMAAQQARTQELERKLDLHIEELKSSTANTLKKFTL